MTLLYLLRRDLRFADSPIFHQLSTSTHNYTHLLPVYYFHPGQVEVSGFLSGADKTCPYPEARSRLGKFWRTGEFRAKFLAESVWDLKKSLESVGSGLVIRVGQIDEVIQNMVSSQSGTIKGIWMTRGVGTEEEEEEKLARRCAEQLGVAFKLWVDESYLIHDADLPTPAKHVSDIFTNYRKTVEPLRKNVRAVLPRPKKLPPLPSNIKPQPDPFVIPERLEEIQNRLCAPLKKDYGVDNPPSFPDGAKSCHEFKGGESAAQERLAHLIKSHAVSAYKDTRNGLVGVDSSTKFSAFLSLGTITARQIHAALYAYEQQGTGEDKGTAAIRFELLWRDYMRLCAIKYRSALFSPGGFGRHLKAESHWKFDADAFRRWQNGTTGTGLIDASQRELFLTGFTSNRARQNVASFLTKHLHMDWRLGAEWYESRLVDFDVASNWGNWQYVAGVGNDPRGDDRVFNPVKQASDYDNEGEFVRMWIPELRQVKSPEGVWQAWTLSQQEKVHLNLSGLTWVDKPLKRIYWSRRGGGRGGGRRGDDERGTGVPKRSQRRGRG